MEILDLKSTINEMKVLLEGPSVDLNWQKKALVNLKIDE